MESYDKELITILGEKPIEFIELAALELQVSIGEGKVLTWLDVKDGYERWLYIELSDEVLKRYISNEISLFEASKLGEVHIAHRSLYSFNEVKIVDKNVGVTRYNYPWENSFLGYDLTNPLSSL